MKPFGTFTVDHTKLDRGIYLGRKDKMGVDGNCYTIDIRLRRPYFEEVLSNMVMHSLEHILATRLEKYLEGKEFFKKVYCGPMGCQTGMYVVIYSEYSDVTSRGMILETLKRITDPATEVPYNDEVHCGNCETLAKYPCDMELVNRELENIQEMVKSCILRDEFDEYPYIK